MNRKRSSGGRRLTQGACSGRVAWWTKIPSLNRLNDGRTRICQSPVAPQGHGSDDLDAFPSPHFRLQELLLRCKAFRWRILFKWISFRYSFLDSSNEHWTKPGLTTVGKRRNDKSDFSTLGVFLWTDEEGNVIVACAIVNQSSIES